MSPYTLDNCWALAHERLICLEAVLDPGTFRVLETVGVRTGWYCLEVGAGAGSVARWLADRVGLNGSVVATDIEPRHLSPLAAEYPNMEVRRHDIVDDPLPTGAFDLIHARLVLEHLPARDQALQRLAESLAPGGWLVIEAIDFGSEAADPALGDESMERFTRWHAAQTRFLADNGFDLTFARSLARRLRGLGLRDVQTDGRASTWWGGAPGGELWRLSAAQLRDPLLAGGYLDREEIAGIDTMLASPEFAATSPLIIAAWGRRPLPAPDPEVMRARIRRSLWTGG